MALFRGARAIQKTLTAAADSGAISVVSASYHKNVCIQLYQNVFLFVNICRALLISSIAKDDFFLVIKSNMIINDSMMIIRSRGDRQVHTYKVSHGTFHSVLTCMISRETSIFTSHPRRRQCVLRQECVPLPRGDTSL